MFPIVKRLRAIWQSVAGDSDRRVRLGRILGLLFMTAGFIVIGKAWDGAASINFAQGQIPYLLSGGFMGLGLIVTGATLLNLATVRAEREISSKQFEEVTRLLGRNLNRLSVSTNGSGSSMSGQVVTGASTFHRAECRLLEGKDGLSTVTVDQAEAEGLDPCRVCSPPHNEKAEATAAKTTEAKSESADKTSGKEEASSEKTEVLATAKENGGR
jgi:hypothetical protein